MRRMYEAKLVKVEVFNDGNSWSMQWKGQTYVHRGDTESFSKLLKKIKASDTHKDPKSYRDVTYKQMAADIAGGTDRYIWVWEHMLKKLYEETEMKKIRRYEAKTAKCPDCGGKYLVQTGYCVSCKKKVAKPKSEAVVTEKEDPKAKKIIKDLAKSYGSSNEEQGKMISLMKGLAFSDDAEANKFMKALDKWTTEYAKKMGESIGESSKLSKKLTVSEAEEIIKKRGVSSIIIDGKSEEVYDIVQQEWGTYIFSDSFDGVDFQTILASVGIRKADITYLEYNYPPSISVSDSQLSRRGKTRDITFRL